MSFLKTKRNEDRRMNCKIIVDSCGELTDTQKADPCFVSVPLELDVDESHFVDDESFSQADFLQKVKASKNCPKSSCPSPERYLEAYQSEQERIYVVTLSAKLSGSYNSAQLAKQLYEEEYGEKQIYVFDSKSASVGETLIAMKIKEYEQKGLFFEEVVQKTEEYISSQNTYFVLETLDTLQKNGRLSNLKALVAGALNIKPVMGSTPEGNICELAKSRGMNKALERMAQEIVSRLPDDAQRTLGISHCNCPERAELLKEKLEQKGQFKEIFIVDTAGISTMYANDGGIIVAV